MLISMTLNSTNEPEQQSSVEGLAYASLEPKVKEEIVSSTELMTKLVDIVKDASSPAPVIYGCLNVFANITAYKPTESEEQKRMTQLKAYANSSKAAPENILNNDAHVRNRCRKVLDEVLVPHLLTRSKSSSLAVLTLIIQIIHSISKEQKHRGLLAQQGAVKLLIQTIDRLELDTNSAAGNTNLIKQGASHALARILISVNPSHVFSSALPITSALRSLLTLLVQDPSSETHDLLPTFESLLALTNLASTEDGTVREILIRTSFPKFEELLLHGNTMIQRAAVELICNLMASPSCVARFADGSKPAGNRMQILLALADVDDLATRKAAGGALAMLTEWDAAVGAVLHKERGVRILLAMCNDEGNEEIRHRGMVCILHVVSAPGEVGEKGIAMVKKENGVEVLKGALDKCKDPEVMGLAVEVLKKLT
jgi:hypothetical protein